MGTGAPPSSSFPELFSDLSTKLPRAYQLLDVAARTLDMAIRTGGFYKEEKVLAGITKIASNLKSIIAHYSPESEEGEGDSMGGSETIDTQPDDMGEGETAPPVEGTE